MFLLDELIKFFNSLKRSNVTLFLFFKLAIIEQAMITLQEMAGFNSLYGS